MSSTLHPSLDGARACLFDAGGTLVHPDWPRLAALAEEVTGRAFEAGAMGGAFGEMLRAVGAEMRQGVAFAPGEQKRHWTFRRVYRSLGLDEAACERVVERLDASHTERHVWCVLDPEAPRVIEELKRQGLLVGVISNTEDGRLLDCFAAAQLSADFDLVLDSHVVGLRKPEAAIFRAALDALGVEPHEAAHVGDSYAHDALAARAVGMRAVLLDPLGLHPESLCPRIGRLSELINAA